MLGGLALKWRWRERVGKLGKVTDRPNLVMGSNTQVCWHKFARYWDVEAREVPLEGDEVVTNPERAAAACDENTIGVVSVLGSTFTGHYEDVATLSVALDRLQDSGALSPLARANALVVREPGALPAPVGTPVPVYLTDIA